MAKKYRFTVTGKFPFPLDMLRYDVCYPVTSEDASTMSLSLGPIREAPRDENKLRTALEVTLISDRAPTEDRWSSFGWHVTKTERF